MKKFKIISLVLIGFAASCSAYNQKYQLEKNIYEISHLDGNAKTWRVNGIKANLKNADLKNEDLTRFNLYQADITNANLTNAYLCKADLTNANLCQADLTNANLTNAYLWKANLKGANLTGANLTGANFKGAHIRGACIAGINPFIALWKFMHTKGTPIRTLEKAQEAGFIVDPQALQEEKLRDILPHNPFVN